MIKYDKILRQGYRTSWTDGYFIIYYNDMGDGRYLEAYHEYNDGDIMRFDTDGSLIYSTYIGDDTEITYWLTRWNDML